MRTALRLRLFAPTSSTPHAFGARAGSSEANIFLGRQACLIRNRLAFFAAALGRRYAFLG
ncbi:MAG: hypothetical protein ACI87C_001005 [Paraperlucidibaca sp.]|jgi:hypothetical protein